MYEKGREGGRSDHSSVNMQSVDDMRLEFERAQQIRRHYDDDEHDCCTCCCFCKILLCIAVIGVIALIVYFGGLI